MYAPINYDRSKYIRCDACGVLKLRSYKVRLTNEQKCVILLLHRRYNYGYRTIATITKHDYQTVKRVIRKYDR